jgi:lantibiotic leader peptide-processing serine protease
MIRLKALPVIGVLALAACADIPVQPSAPEALRRNDASLLAAAQADGPSTYILSFKSERVPQDVDAIVASYGGKILFRHERTGLAIVGGLDAAGVAALGAHKELEAMDADAFTRLQPIRTFGKKRDPVDPRQAILYPEQWYLNAVGAPAAWDHQRFGSERTEIGILDTGIDYLNPEFAGLLDLAKSEFFSDNVPVELVPDGIRSLADLNGHGTIVANTAASKAVWTAGVTSNAALVALKVCNIAGDCDLGATLAAVLYAADLGLEVINISSGGIAERRGRKIQPGPSLIRIVEKIFRYAHHRGVTVVASAGNEARNFDVGLDLDGDGDLERIYNLYCDVPNVICVSATGPNFVTTKVVDGEIFIDELQNIDTPTDYTNFGRRVDVAAPGGSIAAVDIGGFALIPILGACSRFIPGIDCGDIPVFVTAGTSFAAPQVAALAALLTEDIKFRRNPFKIAQRIFRTATDCGAPGKDVFCGHGQINIAKALGFEGDTR